MEQQEKTANSIDNNSALSGTEARFRQLNAAADPQCQIQQISPAALAYLGDAVYELYIRSHYLLPPKRLCDYHDQVVAQVRAESQANTLRSLEPYLTEPELTLLRRGRNAATGTSRRLNRKIYQQATSLETLLGYLYLTDPQRLTQLLAYLELDSPE